MTNTLEWLNDAACATYDPEEFFPIGVDYRTMRAAIIVCEQCPVRQQCLEFAIDTRCEYGVFGGTTPDQRKAMGMRAFTMTADAYRGMPPHGTEARRSREVRMGIKYCPACDELAGWRRTDFGKLAWDERRR